MTKFLEIFNQLVEKKGIKRNKVFTDLKLGKTSYSNWETRDTIPGGDTLIKLAKYFDVTVEYLLGEADEQEMEHAKKYTILDEDGKETVDITLEKEYKRCTEKPKPMDWAIPSVDESKAVASAETDTYKPENPPETEEAFIEVPKNEV